MKPKYLTGPLAGFSALLLCMACEPSVTVHHLNNNEARLHFACCCPWRTERPTLR